MGVRICPGPLINMPSAGMHMFHSHCVRVFFNVRVTACYHTDLSIHLAANLLHTSTQTMRANGHNKAQKENQLPPCINADKRPDECEKVKGHLYEVTKKDITIKKEKSPAHKS